MDYVDLKFYCLFGSDMYYFTGFTYLFTCAHTYFIYMDSFIIGLDHIYYVHTLCVLCALDIMWT